MPPTSYVRHGRRTRRPRAPALSALPSAIDVFADRVGARHSNVARNPPSRSSVGFLARRRHEFPRSAHRTLSFGDPVSGKNDAAVNLRACMEVALAARNLGATRADASYRPRRRRQFLSNFARPYSGSVRPSLGVRLEISRDGAPRPLEPIGADYHDSRGLFPSFAFIINRLPFGRAIRADGNPSDDLARKLGISPRHLSVRRQPLAQGFHDEVDRRHEDQIEGGR